MPLALVIEDGSGVSGANSYATITEIKNYAANRGVDLSSVDSSQIIGWAIVAMDMLESFRDQFKGVKTAVVVSDFTGLLQWPRSIQLSSAVWSEFTTLVSPNVQIDGIDVGPNEIPQLLKDAQCQLVIEQNNGISLRPTSSPNATVKLVKVGPITREFFSADNQPLIPAFDALIKPLLSDQSGEFLHSVRI